MNRFKKELRKKGVKLNKDYPWLPYYLNGSFMEPGFIVLDEVLVNSQRAEVTEVLNVGIFTYGMQRNGNIEMLPDEDDNPRF